MLAKQVLVPILFFCFCPCLLFAQDSNNGRMLLYEVSGNEYIKKDFTSDSTLTGKQVIRVGSVQKQDGSLKMPVELYSYDENGQQTDSTRTVYSCNPDHKTILLNIFPFANYGSGSEIKVEVKGKNELYPVNPEPGQSMQSLRFEMDLDKGITGFLGGRSSVDIFNRQVIETDTLISGQYAMTSEVTIKAYLLGIRIKSIHYQVTEIVDTTEGIKKQTFKEEGGSYFTIEMTDA